MPVVSVPRAAQCVLFSPIPGIWPSQSAGLFQGMEESFCEESEQPPRRAPETIRRKKTKDFLNEDMEELEDILPPGRANASQR